MNREICVVIPAYEPSALLVGYVKELKAYFEKIIVVNDGSSPSCNSYFEKLKLIGIVVLEHEHNMGKGAALKTAFNFYLENFDLNTYNGIVTVDADGQHAINDVIKVANNVKTGENALILGSRSFGSDVPLRSKFGNTLTSKMFKLLYKTTIRDTQTGLRGIQNNFVKELIQINGDRYEYETNVLIYCINNEIDIKELDIETIYIDNNSSSHFNPFVDSLKIYKLFFGDFLKFFISSLASFVIDILLFYIILNVSRLVSLAYSIVVATISARVISSFVNYLINRKVVFKSDNSICKTVIKYYCLVIFNMLLSAFMVTFIYNMTGFSETGIKVLVDTCIFIISYNVQKNNIFR